MGLDSYLMERWRENFRHSFPPILQPRVAFQLIPLNYNLPHPHLLLSMSPCSQTKQGSPAPRGRGGFPLRHACTVGNQAISLLGVQFGQKDEARQHSSVLFPSSCLMLPGMLLWLHVSISLSFLVDSDADDCFVNQDLVKQANIPFETLAEPKNILDLDGKTLAKVTHSTAPLTLIISGKHPIIQSNYSYLFILFLWGP